ncbi:NUDIX domain-containing protein [Galbitalea sp. SE-J8]|uniref:NUDIX hydrolase n=1 Tax=Galbitalea sp. SE-J8 TaxID=3054952 RepID=UPI00259CA9E6|nr:NUDIX domain-containing protein [Galbitalea sp. SE-J8]MDM4763776.1 NUDIX domain-containing protein [Galbitalea sp. SE-J8]
MSSAATPPVLAAGAVCWRLVDGKPRVLLVHRAARADVSLPKGKVDPGETLPQTAKREVAEETGLRVDLGAPLGDIRYKLANGRDKVVYYWAAEVAEHALELASFVPNDEIASLEWVPLAKARKKLSYPYDADVLDRFADRFDRGVARTFAIVVLRHGKAVPADAWDGADATRPLLQRGNDQAVNVAPGIAAFAPAKLISSTAVRCRSTIAPLAGYLGEPVKETAAISQDSFEYGQADVAGVVAKRLAKCRTTVLCSHGPVIPEILGEIARQSHSPRSAALGRASSLGTGEFAVVHLSIADPAAGIVAVETHGPALA